MAEIFRAKTFSHGGFENLLVIKRILPHLGERPEFVDMFIDEAKVAVSLQHPNITQVFDFGKVGDGYFIAMECIDGKDLLEIMKALARQKKRLPIPFAAFIAMEVCRGLMHAHTRKDVDGQPLKIVHRDVSPGNVLISYEGMVKLADFGIARAVFANAPEMGMLKGKYEYMSPEQAAGEIVDYRSDLFSIGVILWEMLTGKRAFRTSSEEETLDRVRSVNLPNPKRVNPAVPDALDAICMKALSLERSNRFADAREMYDALRTFMGGVTSEHARSDLTRFMGAVFESEIAHERRSLKAGTVAALQWREGGWDDADSNTLSSWTRTNLIDQARAAPAVAALAIVAVLLMTMAAVSMMAGSGATNVPVIDPAPVIERVP